MLFGVSWFTHTSVIVGSCCAAPFPPAPAPRADPIVDPPLPLAFFHDHAAARAFYLSATSRSFTARDNPAPNGALVVIEPAPNCPARAFCSDASLREPALGLHARVCCCRSAALRGESSVPRGDLDEVPYAVGDLELDAVAFALRLLAAH